MQGEPFVILLIEDNPDHAEPILRSLRKHPLTDVVYHVPDGEAALDYLFRRGSYADSRESPRPDVILLDLRLPKVDGLEVLREIKIDKSLRHVPVVVLTTSDSNADVVQAYDCYVNSYLVKPVEFAQFTQLMQVLGTYWLGWNRGPGS